MRIQQSQHLSVQVSSPEYLQQLPVLQTELGKVCPLSLPPPPVSALPPGEGVGVQLGPDIERGRPLRPQRVLVQEIQHLAPALQKSAVRERLAKALIMHYLKPFGSTHCFQKVKDFQKKEINILL